MNISSQAFRDGETIPKRYSRHGMDINPPLRIEDCPPGTHSLALIMDDVDAPNGTFTHWLVFDIPPETAEIPEGHTPLSDDGVGKNGWGELAYGGPKPPSGEHRYYFRLHALDTKLSLPPGSNREEVVTAMKDHVLESAVLMGRFAASDGN